MNALMDDCAVQCDMVANIAARIETLAHAMRITLSAPNEGEALSLARDMLVMIRVDAQRARDRASGAAEAIRDARDRP